MPVVFGTPGLVLKSLIPCYRWKYLLQFQANFLVEASGSSWWGPHWQFLEQNYRPCLSLWEIPARRILTFPYAHYITSMNTKKRIVPYIWFMRKSVSACRLGSICRLRTTFFLKWWTIFVFNIEFSFNLQHFFLISLFLFSKKFPFFVGVFLLATKHQSWLHLLNFKDPRWGGI